MAEPRTDWPDPVAGAIIELMSAESALNMHPSPIAEPQGEYLSDTDQWVAHAYQHIRAAIELVCRACDIPIEKHGNLTIIDPRR